MRTMAEVFVAEMVVALRLIETRGMVGAVKAADAMVKAANARLVGAGCSETGGACCASLARGDAEMLAFGPASDSTTL